MKDKDQAILLTGAAGFIGSAMWARLLEAGYRNIVAVDDFTVEAKRPNWEGKACAAQVQREDLAEWLEGGGQPLGCVIHLGARTDTTEQDWEIFRRLNLEYSQMLWRHCVKAGIPFLYASSAATYGDGHLGFVDDHALVPQLEPLNPYGESKQAFDQYALDQVEKPPYWAGFKFFNVYGPNEYHKGRMASVVFHAFRQIKESAGMSLFRSHRPDYEDGAQSRDFIYVKDVTRTLLHFMEDQPLEGLVNLGTGRARSFLDLTRAVFDAMDVREDIHFIDTPADIRDSYQYFTEAEVGKLKAAGVTSFTSLEEGIKDYVQNYLKQGRRI